MVRGSCRVVLTVWLLMALPSFGEGNSLSRNTTEESSYDTSQGDQSGSGGGEVQPQLSGQESSTEAPSATEKRIIYQCPLPWSGFAWVGNSKKTFEVVNMTSRRTVCRDLPVEEEKCSFSWSSGCLTDFSKCFTCYTIIKGKHTVCKEEEILVPQLVLRDRVQLNSRLGSISPVSQSQRHYSRSSEIVWQLEAMEGHGVYLELTNIELHNEEGQCGDYIEISFNPCTPPTRICNNQVKVYTWFVSQRKMQVRFVSDHLQHSNGNGFSGAYYYNPVSTSTPSQDANGQLNQPTNFTSNATARSITRSRGRREILKQLFAGGMLADNRAGSTAVNNDKTSHKDTTFPLMMSTNTRGSTTGGTHSNKFNWITNRKKIILSSERESRLAFGGKKDKEARSITEEGGVLGLKLNNIAENAYGEDQQAIGYEYRITNAK